MSDKRSLPRAILWQGGSVFGGKLRFAISFWQAYVLLRF